MNTLFRLLYQYYSAKCLASTGSDSIYASRNSQIVEVMDEGSNESNHTSTGTSRF